MLLLLGIAIGAAAGFGVSFANHKILSNALKKGGNALAGAYPGRTALILAMFAALYFLGKYTALPQIPMVISAVAVLTLFLFIFTKKEQAEIDARAKAAKEKEESEPQPAEQKGDE